MKILVTGINGQVGSALVRQAYDHRYEVVAISREQWDMEQFPEQGEDLILKEMPDLVINPAAYTNVDGAEEDEIKALKVNADTPKVLAKLVINSIFHYSIFRQTTCLMAKKLSHMLKRTKQIQSILMAVQN